MNEDYKMMGYAIGHEEKYEILMLTAGGLPMSIASIGKYYGLIKVYKHTYEASADMNLHPWADTIYSVYLDQAKSMLKLIKMKE